MKVLPLWVQLGIKRHSRQFLDSREISITVTPAALLSRGLDPNVF
jgi:hypothetical protein